MKENLSEPLAVVFEEAAFLALQVPEVCRAGVIANLAMLNDHAACLNHALPSTTGGEGEEV